MRQQYHFNKTEEGRDAWDVFRLIELSQDLPVTDVAVASFDIDHVCWFDSDASPPTVRRVIEHAGLIHAADCSYPLILGADGRVMDGMHRIAKAVMQGITTLPAVQFAVDPEPDHRNVSPGDLPYRDRELPA